MPITTTTIVTTPPNMLDIHYWMFGMFVTFGVTAFLLGALTMKAGVQVGSDTFIMMTLIGMFVGSLVALMMNMLPWLVPIGFFLVLLVYFMRLRG